MTEDFTELNLTSKSRANSSHILSIELIALIE